MDVTPAEIRVLGCLIEKQKTTPDIYPLSLNALRLACNQSTNRDPVLSYDEDTVQEAAQRLGRRGWARFTSGRGARVAKYRQVFDEALGLADDETALLAVLMLRGAQTPGELKGRAERLHRFADLSAVEDTLARLVDRGLAEGLERRPGQKERRYRHLLGGDEPAPPSPATAAPPASAPGPPDGEPAPSSLPTTARPAPAPGAAEEERALAPAGEAPRVAAGGPIPERVARLEADVAELRAAVEALRRELGV